VAISLPLSIMRPSPPQIGRVWLRHAIAWKRFYRTSIVLNFFEPITGLVGLGLGTRRPHRGREVHPVRLAFLMADPLHEKVLMLLLEAPHVGGLRSGWSPSREVKHA
jgi:hypothetical protein